MWREPTRTEPTAGSAVCAFDPALNGGGDA